MSSQLIASDLQGLVVDSGYIELFELSLNESTTVYFTSAMEVNGPGSPQGSPTQTLNFVQFRNRTNPSQINVYYPIPAQMSGIEHRTEGQLPQPKLTIANVLKTTGADSFAGLTSVANYEDLLGQKIVRRKTLVKYLYNNPGDANPPVELPPDMYYLDRIENENKETVVFTLLSAIDLDGVTLPRRTIIGNACAWQYQGAAVNKNEWDKKGGCTWHTESQTNRGGVVTNVYANEDDEYLISDSFSFPVWAGGPVDRNEFASTLNSTITDRIEPSGNIVASSVYDYWQSKIDGNSTTPSDSNTSWRRVRIYDTYSAATGYSVYTNPKYNDYTLYNGQIWQAQTNTMANNLHPALPGESKTYWKRGDSCGKRVSSCAMRYGCNPVLALNFDAQTSNFTVNRVIVGVTTGDRALIISVTDAGSTGTLYLRNVTGPFLDGEIITEQNPITGALNGGSATVNGSMSNSASVPDITLNEEKAILPFGGFPTARVFD